MPVITEIRDYLSFGRCVYISNGKIEAYVTIDQGPRVIHLGLFGGENMFWTDEARAGSITAEGLDKVYGRGDVYDLLGGHRLWTSPEHEIHSYFPDSDPVEYVLTANGCAVKPPARPLVNLQHAMVLEMDGEKPLIMVSVSVTNSGSTASEFAPWTITQLAPGGLQVFPQPKRATGLLADRIMAIWPYTDMGDPRLTFADDYISLRQDPSNSRPIKIGMFGVPYALYQNFGAVFAKRAIFNPQGRYPDYGCSFETYTNNLFLEMETLGELSEVPPGDTVHHSETWELFEQSKVLSPEALLEKYA